MITNLRASRLLIFTSHRLTKQRYDVPTGRIRDAVKWYEGMCENVRFDKIIPVSYHGYIEKYTYIYSVITS